MALPDALKKTLENALIPLQGIGYASLALTAVITIGAQFSPHKRELEETGLRTSGLSLASLLTVMGIQSVLMRDEQKRLASLRRQFPWVEGVEPENNRVVTERQIEPTVPARRPSFLDELAELAGIKEEIKPSACVGCRHYHGMTYHGEKGANRLICGMHPSGSSGDTCPDWEGVPKAYRLIRIQGAGFSNLFFVHAVPGMEISEMMKHAVTVHPMYRDRLMKRYRLKSASGLPGCVFESNSEDIEQAFIELLDSCPDE